jgi:heptosyltransferase-2
MNGIRNILVIRLSSIGDIILTTPLLEKLHAVFPDARIDYLTKTPFVSLIASNPVLSGVFTPEKMPAASYDLAVDLQNNWRSAHLMRSLKAGRVVRYRKQNWKKWMLVRFKLNFYGTCRSVADRYLDALDDLLPDRMVSGCALYPSDTEKTFASGILDGKSMTLAVSFGARHFTKRYPPEKFASVLAIIAEKLPVHFFLLGGKEDEAEARRIMELLPEHLRRNASSLAGKCSLMETAAVLQQIDAVLCNDTGLMHMASAFGRTLFVIFGSSAKEFGFLPFHAPYKLFEVDGLKCRPCSHIGRDACPEGHFRCMNGISETLIADAIIAHFNRIRS